MGSEVQKQPLTYKESSGGFGSCLMYVYPKICKLGMEAQANTEQVVLVFDAGADLPKQSSVCSEHPKLLLTAALRLLSSFQALLQLNMISP